MATTIVNVENTVIIKPRRSPLKANMTNRANAAQDKIFIPIQIPPLIYSIRISRRDWSSMSQYMPSSHDAIIPVMDVFSEL